MKRTLSKYIMLVLAMLLSLGGIAGAIDDKKSIYVIDVKTEVTPGLYNYINNSIQKAEDEGADLILLEIDTFGGRVDSAISISDAIISSTVPTAAYINKKAISAGVLISISCDRIYMAPGATIGSAETIPATEKNISFWKKQLKTVAEEKGRDPQVVMAMADKDIEIEGLIEKGKLLNLTTNEAVDIGFIDGKALNRRQIYESLDIESFSETEIESTVVEDFINIISSSYVAPLLLALGFIGMIIEIITPGFGVGGIISIIGFSLFFMGSILGGSAQVLSVIVFMVGMVLLVIEAAAPGFGVFGVLGISSIIMSVVMASRSVAQAVMYIVIAIALTAVVITIIFKKLPKRKLSKTLLLDTNLNKDEGYISSEEKSQYLGKEGVCLSFLRPSGKIEIEGEMLDAIAESGLIEKGEKVKVIRVEGSKIIVRKKGEE